MDPAVLAVRGQGFLGRLKPSLVDEVLEAAVLVHLSADDRNVPVRTCIVVSGLLAYFLLHQDGRQITIRYATAGDLVGSVAPPNTSVSTGVHAIERSMLLRLDAARLQAIARRDPELSMALVEELTKRLRVAYRALASRAFGSVTSRVARDLVARARASSDLRDGVTVQVTRESLADATGSVREVVARSLRDLRRRGLIEPDRGRVTIIDALRLTREADPIESPN